MSDLLDLPDLAREVTERVVVPPYDEVSRRVRARRLRGWAGSVTAAVLLVGGVAVWQDAATTAGLPDPQPAEDLPIPPTDESQWRAVLDAELAHPFEVEGTDDGSIAVVYRGLEQPEPTFALVIREADGSLHGRRLDAPVDLTPVPGGWVGVNTARGWFIGTDGTWADLGAPQEGRAPRASDVVVSGQFGLWVFSPDDRSWARMHFDGVAEGLYLTPDGDQVTCAGERAGVVVRREAREALVVMGDACVLAGHREAVAVVALGDEPDGSLPMTGFATSADGGVTWDQPPRRKLGSVTSLAVSANGTTIVSGTDGKAFVIHPDTGYSHPEPALGVAFAAGDRLYATSYADDMGPLLYSDDNGWTWEETTLPGLE